MTAPVPGDKAQDRDALQEREQDIEKGEGLFVPINCIVNRVTDGDAAYSLAAVITDITVTPIPPRCSVPCRGAPEARYVALC